MRGDPRLFEDLSRIAGGALGALSGVRQEVEALVRQALDRLIAELDLVRREEFDAALELAQRARTETEELAARLVALEARLSPPPADAAPLEPALDRAPPEVQD